MTEKGDESKAGSHWRAKAPDGAACLRFPADERAPGRWAPLKSFGEAPIAPGRRFLERHGGSRTRFRPGLNLRGGEPRPAPSATVRLQAAHAEGWAAV